MPYIRFVLISSLLTATGFATTITATSATQALSKAGTNQWQKSLLTGLETINWSSGENAADTRIFCSTPCKEGAEPKFDPGAKVGTYKGRTFGGFDMKYKGPHDSISEPKGSGDSTIGPCNQFSNTQCGTANWTVTADGTLGDPKKGALSWITTAAGNDPWPFFANDFANLSSSYDLWVPLGIDSATLSALGSVGLDAEYQTASGFLDLLNIGISEAGVSVTGGALPGIQYYLLSNILQDPSLDPASLLTAAQLQAMISADFAGGDTLQNPLLIGIYVPNLAVPTVELADGSVAAVHIDTTAFDQASAPFTPTPEPASCCLAALGVGVLAVAKFKYSRVAG
jgi:hypothetical protein